MIRTVIFAGNQIPRDAVMSGLNIVGETQASTAVTHSDLSKALAPKETRNNTAEWWLQLFQCF